MRLFNLFSAGTLLLCIASASAATVSVQVDREDIRVGESVNLTFSSGKYTFDDPDFSPVGKGF